MKLVVGLGNPGKKYEKTRHNVGFMVLDYFAKQNELSFKKNMNGLCCETVINDEKILLLKPQSYMNLSGDVVRKYFDYYKFEIKDIIIIYDDVDFSTGTFKIKRTGSSAGHNGIKDIIQKMGTENINRIRVGTSKNEEILYDYVLGKMSSEELKKIDSILPIISNAIRDFSNTDIEELMSKYNKKE